MEPTLSASQNPRTHIGIRRGVVRKTPSFVITKISDFRTTPGLCRALVKGRTPTDTPATAATDDLCCGGAPGVFGCYRFHASPHRDERGRNYIRHRSFRWLRARDHGEATGHRARGTSLPIPVPISIPVPVPGPEYGQSHLFTDHYRKIGHEKCSVSLDRHPVSKLDVTVRMIRSVTMGYQPVSADRPGTVVCPPIQQYVMKLVVTDRMKRRGDRLETG